jgi:thiol-disulfide isomerase/thioredoxin
MNLIKTAILTIILFLSLPAFGQNQPEIAVMQFSELEPYLHFKNDTTYIVNFWATWCVPCRKELPVIENIHNEYLDKPLKVLLVSLDFPSQMENGLKPFLLKNNITARVILLNDPKSNVWIDKVDPTWSGSLPATLIYKNDFRQFLEKELDYDTLKSIILKII